VELEDGTVTAMVGDVSGHDSTAAAIGAILRASWRALVFVESDPLTIIAALDRTMREEQRRPGRFERFATVCSVHVDHEAGLLRIVLAGHHPPLLLTDGEIRPILGAASPPLGVSWAGKRDVVEVPIPAGAWSLFLYTDGLIEGRAAPGGSERYGADRLAALIASRGRTVLTDDDLDGILAEIRRANGGPLTDDVVAFSLAPLSPALAGVAAAPERRSGP
jgi:serine phosphatase RsbU (regulator of sigma subunit)